MSFILNTATKIQSDITAESVKNAVNILKRDMGKTLSKKDIENSIVLRPDPCMEEESYSIKVTDSEIKITASDNLGFVYGLLRISSEFLGIKPFWFWLDQKITKRETAEIKCGEYTSPEYAVKYRGWFFNDEVLLLKWDIDGDKEMPWRMAFETLLRCGGNMTIPGTDKTTRTYRKLASDMGLWITHHHAEPLGAEMFSRAYPDTEPNFMENPELFYKLWEESVKEQADFNVVWNLCFRGQGDCPFWSSDTSGQFDSAKKRGQLISSLIKKQCDIVKKYVENPVFCTNLYGEIMELYNDGYIDLDDDIIKVRADNGYGKMVTRRRDNHNVRVSSMPEKNGGKQGIYYHVSFYDLQAANHITPLPNSVDFVDKELSSVLECDGGEFWVINCSNVRPHVYYLDAVRKKWLGQNISDESHSREFTDEYYGGNGSVMKCLADYPKAMVAYGNNDDEHAGEQFYTENARIIAHQFITDREKPTGKLKWLFDGESLYEQAEKLMKICMDGHSGIYEYFNMCQKTLANLSGNEKELFESTVYQYALIHKYCLEALISLLKAILEFQKCDYEKAFILAGDSAKLFEEANNYMRNNEKGVWQGFYYNDCFADIKHSAYMAKKVMGIIREYGDNARHDKWYRKYTYAEEDRDVMLLLVLDNHMTDEELYEVMRGKVK